MIHVPAADLSAAAAWLRDHGIWFDAVVDGLFLGWQCDQRGDCMPVARWHGGVLDVYREPTSGLAVLAGPGRCEWDGDPATDPCGGMPVIDLDDGYGCWHVH